MTSVKPWYMSKTVWGALVAAAGALGGLMGVPIDEADQAQIVDAVLQLVTLAGGIVALFGRFSADSRIL